MDIASRFGSRDKIFSPTAVRPNELPVLLNSDQPISVQVNAKESLHALICQFIPWFPTGAVVDRAVEVCWPDDVLILVLRIRALQQDLEAAVDLCSSPGIPFTGWSIGVGTTIAVFQGDGDDTMTGGKGPDSFVMSKGHDVVTDFRRSENDRIFLSGDRLSGVSREGKNYWSN